MYIAHRCNSQNCWLQETPFNASVKLTRKMHPHKFTGFYVRQRKNFVQLLREGKIQSDEGRYEGRQMPRPRRRPVEEANGHSY